MQTDAIYLNDSYQKTADARVLNTLPDGPNTYRILLDKTVFYPMGGGQSTDQGKLSSSDWSADVYQVMMRDGEIWHYVKSPTAPAVGATLDMEINWDRRYRNMRLHSAGHVVDFAMYLLHYSPSPLMPFKGDHGKKPFIQYQGSAGRDIKNELEIKANELVEKNLAFSWLFQPYEDLKNEAIYLQPGLPTNKPLRTLRLETVGAVADGGTQVKHTGEVGKIQITAVEDEGVLTTVRYALTS